MGDVLVGAVPAPAAPVEATAKVNPVVAAREARAAKLVSVGKALAAALPSEMPPPAEKPVQPPTPDRTVEVPFEKPESEAKEPVADEPKVEAKTEEPKVEEHDAKTKKALEAIDKQAKKFRDEQVAAKRAFEQEMHEQRTELARLKQELTSKYGAAEELAKLVKRDPVAALRKLGVESEDDWELVGRSAFPLTKAGKADPRSAEAAQRMQKETGRDSEIAELRQKYDALMEQMTTREKQAEAQTFVEKWIGEALKAVPADKPTLISRLVAKSPERAKQALLAIGHELEQQNDGETPSHADVIAEYERREREELELRGVDVDALLRPSAAPAPVKSKTLDPEAPKGGTRPINTSATRADKLAAVSQGLAKLSSETT
jgi:hypothetical protein